MEEDKGIPRFSTEAACFYYKLVLDNETDFSEAITIFPDGATLHKIATDSEDAHVWPVPEEMPQFIYLSITDSRPPYVELLARDSVLVDAFERLLATADALSEAPEQA